MNVCMYDNGIMNVLLLNLGSEREFSMWIFVTASKTGVPSNVEHNWEELGVSNDLTNENCREGGVWFDPIIRIYGFIYNALIGEFQIFVYVNRIIRRIGTFLSSGISFKSSAPAPVRLRRYGYLLWRPSSNLGDLTANFGEWTQGVPPILVVVLQYISTPAISNSSQFISIYYYQSLLWIECS